jgi:hypothetical protein
MTTLLERVRTMAAWMRVRRGHHLQLAVAGEQVWAECSCGWTGLPHACVRTAAEVKSRFVVDFGV